MTVDVAPRIIGRSVARLDGVPKVTGLAHFVADLPHRGALVGKLVLSPHPHALLRHVDVAPAQAVPGVVSTFCRDDLDGLDYRYGLVIRDQTLVAIDRVRYEGDVVAAVAATDEVFAEEGCRAVVADYDPLPTVATIDDALAAGAPVLHAPGERAGHVQDFGRLRQHAGTNICHHFHRERGDVEAAFAAADVVVEDEHAFPSVYHQPMEPHAVVAEYGRDRLTVWAPTQYPFPVQAWLAEIFRLPRSRVRVIVPYVGGGFGGKEFFQIIPLAAALSRKSARPVQITLSSGEAFRTLVRHAARIRVRTGARRDGTLLCREAAVHLDTGAYADSGPRVASVCGYRLQGPYRIPHIRVDAYAVYTNTVPAGAMRGIGAPQAAWAYESQMDRLADALGMDRLEIRLRNALSPGDAYDPDDTPIDGDLGACLRAVADAIRWDAPPARGRGRGIACGFKNGGGINVASSAVVRITADGSLIVLVSTAELGQGAQTALAQIAAETLDIPLERVAVILPDTALTPYDQRTAASRSTAQMGAAIVEAIGDAAAQLAVRVARREGVAVGTVKVGGRVRWPGGDATLAEVMTREFGSAGGEIIGRGYYESERGRGPLGGQSPFWEMGAAACEVEVDAETGQVRVTRYVSASDVGRAINPQMCEGQEEGAAVMGLGHTLSEELHYVDGRLLNGSLVDYRVPRIDDVPDAFTTILVENGRGPGPFGSRGAGETGIVPVGPAVASAVARAIGRRAVRLPLTAPRVWDLLRHEEGREQGQAESEEGRRR